MENSKDRVEAGDRALETARKKTDALQGHSDTDNSGSVRVPSSDEHNPREVLSAQTRLTAEQFWPEWIKQDLEIRPAMELPSTRAIRFAEAFRDKSEVELLETQQSLTNALLESKQEAFRLREEMAILNIKLGVAHKALLNEINTRDGLREQIKELKREGKQ